MIPTRSRVSSAFAVVIFAAAVCFGGPVVVDHNAAAHFHDIPDYWLQPAKADLHIAYQHTSHGSQLVTGMTAVQNFPAFLMKYEWSDDGSSGLDLDDYGIAKIYPKWSRMPHLLADESNPNDDAVIDKLREHMFFFQIER